MRDWENNGGDNQTGRSQTARGEPSPDDRASPSHYLQINFTCEEAKKRKKKYCLDVFSIVLLLREDIK